MSLFGALKTGVSGLSAQSSAMTIISDNIANVSTVGYKANSASFSSLVTKQTSTTKYSSGGVQCRTRAGVDVQGLLSSATNSTDLGIFGNGFFVTTQTSKPDSSDLWSYTRVGNFSVDSDGYLKNDNGYYLQAWTLQAYDGDPDATLVKVGDNIYMKSYTDEKGSTVYINDNIIDSTNLQAINLNTIGGTAQETRNISFGANLPADAPVFDIANPENGGRYTSAVLVYDSLGNSHNAELTFTKTANGTWDLDIGMPSGSATMVTYSSSEVTNDATQDVYSARAQLEFTSIPTNHSTVAMSTNGTTYVYEFTTDGTTTYSPKADETVIAVDLSSGIVTTADAVEKFNAVIQTTMPSAGRFTIGSNGTTIQVKQTNSGGAVSFKVSTTSCLQSAANPDPVTGISSGEFELPEIDWDIKNTARLDFSGKDPASYLNKSVTIGQNTYMFSDVDAPTSNGVVTVNITSALNLTAGTVDTVKLVSLLKNAIDNNESDYSRYVASGSTLELNPTATGKNMLVTSGDAASVTFQNTNVAAYVTQTITIGEGVNAKRFRFSDNPNVSSGTVLTGGDIAVNISGLSDKDNTDAAPIAVMNELYNTIVSYYKNTKGVEDLSNYFQVSGATLVTCDKYLDGAAMNTTVTMNESKLDFNTLTNASDYDGKEVTIGNKTYSFVRGGMASTEVDLTALISQYTLTFGAVPTDGQTVTINGIVYEFDTNGAVTGTNTRVDLFKAVSKSEVVTALAGAGARQPTDGDTVTLGGVTYEFDNNANVTPGNTAVTIGLNINATLTNLMNAGYTPSRGDTIVLNGTTYELTNGTGASGGNTEVNILAGNVTAAEAMQVLATAAGLSTSVTGATLTVDNKNPISTAIGTLTETVNETAAMSALAAKAGKTSVGSTLTLTAYGTEAITSADFTAQIVNGTVNEQLATETASTGIGEAVTVTGKDNGKQLGQPDTDGTLVLTNTFWFNNVENAQSGPIIAGVSFNADGTPKEVNVDKLAIEWANGAGDMTGNYYESSQINLSLGDENTANGLTQLAGKFTTNYITQDGAKFGNYTGVSISEDGIVTAIFDNGETRAIAQIPLATFVDANGLEALSGTAYIETTMSGNATLRTAGDGGAGKISSNSLEDSTVDIAEEFTDMIVTQRAYSAASKIITTSDSMLEELLNIKR